MPHDETIPGLFDDELPDVLRALADRHFAARRYPRKEGRVPLPES